MGSLDLRDLDVDEAEELLREASDEPVNPAWIEAVVASATGAAPIRVPCRRLTAAAALLGLVLCTAAATVVELWNGADSVGTLTYQRAVETLRGSREPEQKRSAALGFVTVALGQAIDALKTVSRDDRAPVAARAAADASLIALKKQLIEAPITSPAAISDDLDDLLAALGAPQVTEAEQPDLVLRVHTAAANGIMTLQLASGSPVIDSQRSIFLKRLLRTLAQP